MSPAHQESLFQYFSQADPSVTRKYGGSGLGLAISQRFWQMMGGNIQVDSEMGRGSTFTVSLPVNAETAQQKRRPSLASVFDYRISRRSKLI